MARQVKTPAAAGNGAGACDRSESRSSLDPNLIGFRTQWLCTAHYVRPDIAVMLASAIFGGAHG